MGDDDGRSPDHIDAAGKLKAEAKPAEARGLNVGGKEPTGPREGFGALWRKTYLVRLSGKKVSPQDVVETWKDRLPDLLPSNSRFYPTLHGIQAGKVIYIDAEMPPGAPVSTGVLVVESDENHFKLVTPQGHPESGYNSFSAFTEEGTVVAQIQSLARAADPLYEFGYRFLGGMKHQEGIWRHVLTSLAGHYGIRRPRIEIRRELLDRRVQWARAGNVWHNALIRTMLHTPLHIVRKEKGKS
jgi:hypothetical protein